MIKTNDTYAIIIQKDANNKNNPTQTYFQQFLAYTLEGFKTSSIIILRQFKYSCEYRAIVFHNIKNDSYGITIQKYANDPKKLSSNSYFFWFRLYSKRDYYLLAPVPTQQ